MKSVAVSLQPKSADERIPVVALLRVSSAEQGSDDRGGLPRQREVVNRTIATKNLNCIEWLELVDVSGTNTSTHPQIRDVLRRILNGEVRGLVVADIDRLFRPTEPANYAMLQVFKDVGAKIYSGDFDYDLTTKDGMLFSSIRSAFAGFELNLMKERQMGACEAKRKAGKCPTNELTLPMGIGYDRKTESWNYTADIGVVTELFTLFDGGLRNYTELGRRFGLGNASVKVLLRNPIYTGWRVIDKRRGPKKVSKSGKIYREKVARPVSEQIRIKILDGVVSQELFDRVQATMKRMAFNHMERRKQDEAINVGTGITYCGHCGLPLFCSSGKRTDGRKRQGYYTCKANHYLYRKRLGGCKQPTVRQSALDDAIIALVAEIIRSPQHLAKLIQSSVERMRAVVSPISVQVKPTARIEELKRRDKRIMTAYEENIISIDELRTKREEIRRCIAALAKLETPAEPAHSVDTLATARLIVKGAMRFTRLTDALARKKIIAELLSEIHVRDQSIVSFRFRDGVFSSSTPGDANPVILLPSPRFVVLPAPTLPKGHKRCIKCGEVKVAEEFYGRLNRCNSCRNEADRERARLRWKARKESTRFAQAP